MVMVSWWNRNDQCRSINLGVICSMSKRVRALGGDLVGVKTSFFSSLESSLKFYFIHTILLYIVCMHIGMVFMIRCYRIITIMSLTSFSQ